jgi:hypothetical protein
VRHGRGGGVLREHRPALPDQAVLLDQQREQRLGEHVLRDPRRRSDVLGHLRERRVGRRASVGGAAERVEGARGVGVAAQAAAEGVGVGRGSRHRNASGSSGQAAAMRASMRSGNGLHGRWACASAMNSSTPGSSSATGAPSAA